MTTPFSPCTAPQVDAGPSTRSLPELEEELLGLAGHLAAAQCRFLRVLAEFDDRAGWAGPGLKSCAHWLSWRIGMSLRTAHEHVRVAHALRALPKVDEAFGAGRISYSKVRAITRVSGRRAEPRDPAVDGARPPDGDPAGPPRSAARGTPPAPSPGEEHPSAARAAGMDTAGVAAAGHDADRGDVTEQTLLDLALAGTASHVEQVVRAARRGRDDGSRCARRSVSWRWADDGSLVLRARLAPAEGAALIATLDALTGPRGAPVRHPVPAPPQGWQERADEESPGAVVDRVAARRADALVELATARALLDTGPTGSGVLRGQARVSVRIDASTGTAALVGGPEIPQATAERLACDARVQVLLEDTARNRLYLGRNRRLASPAQIAALTVRDEGRCQFAGCTHVRHLHAHHVRHWLRGGRTDIDNLVLVCSFHHALLHDRGYRIRRSGPGWQSLRPDGAVVPTCGEPLVGDVESLIEIHARAALRISPTGLTPTWAGERLDPTVILQRLLPPDEGAQAA